MLKKKWVSGTLAVCLAASYVLMAGSDSKAAESADFSGKTIVLFATSGGSNFGKTLEALEDSVHGSARLMEGKILNGKPGKEDLAVWVKSLAL